MLGFLSFFNIVGLRTGWNWIYYRFCHSYFFLIRVCPGAVPKLEENCPDLGENGVSTLVPNIKLSNARPQLTYLIIGGYLIKSTGNAVAPFFRHLYQIQCPNIIPFERENFTDSMKFSQLVVLLPTVDSSYKDL